MHSLAARYAESFKEWDAEAEPLGGVGADSDHGELGSGGGGTKVGGPTGTAIVRDCSEKGRFCLRVWGK
jgi:hypothetical protein